MTLPRSVVYAMLLSSILGLLSLAWLGWVSWPDRTARDFVDRIARGRLNELSGIAKPTSNAFTVDGVYYHYTFDVVRGTVDENWEDRPQSEIDFYQRLYRDQK